MNIDIILISSDDQKITFTLEEIKLIPTIYNFIKCL